VPDDVFGDPVPQELRPSRKRQLSDNAWPYRESFAWRQALADLGASRKLTRAYRPQTSRVNNASGQYT
jgi:hypothetical protein